jgi:hypothetical protein
MEAMAISAVTVKRTTISSRGGLASRSGSGSGARLLAASLFKMDETMVHDGSDQPKPVISKLKPTRCYRPKEWTPEAEEGV